MKKLVFLVAAASLLAISTTSFAATPSKIVVKDKQIQFDVPPNVDKGRTLVPIRALTDSLGASITWNQTSKTATINKWSETVHLTEGKNTAYYMKANQSNKINLDVSVKIINNRVYVPLRFLSQFYGYQVAEIGDSVIVNSPLTPSERNILYRGDLAQARKFVMNYGPKSAHFENKAIPYMHEREGFETTFFFPIGEANRFFLITDDNVSFYELKDDFFVITWQAHIPVGQKDTDQLFLENKVTDATGTKPDNKKDLFFYRTSGLMTSTNITAGKISLDGKITQFGVKRIVGNEVKEESGSLALKLPNETRSEASNQ
ncbi:copper amine oxidase N-terminal domain-containing protein [Paenibacillus sp. BC26]|uniref:copper amine oxidase N-terminal domain-containing protein n=1 Tax=Paenibacillus sp. BC26 TaxID=1881032 RepID=UPI0008E287E3|nr:copper amine oxidase N-terminal domain-containing protein [Paenibacillus sp. BC26]SFS75968.1 Copper amine oxidase N-terminal domain-containing protein [Paenibacillus sp. BC26]